MKKALAILMTGVFLIAGCTGSTPEKDAIKIVQDKGADWPAHKFEAKPNPKGEGIIVYQPGMKAAWLVVNDKVYAINGSAKNITPTASYQRGDGVLDIDDVEEIF
ncbi:MAG: hypothetical protein PVH29_01820 [Candidatus Zixiibacteriota bacterium]|jgi:hypothetical protein